MGIEYLKGDATVPLGTGVKIIVHICNDMGYWGKGFVLELSKKWKAPELDYRSRSPCLGDISLINVDRQIYICNMIAQRGIRGKVLVNYDMLRKCLEKVYQYATQMKASIHMPRIGCGLGGGDWNIVQQIISEELKGLDVFVYDL